MSTRPTPRLRTWPALTVAALLLVTLSPADAQSPPGGLPEAAGPVEERLAEEDSGAGSLLARGGVAFRSAATGEVTLYNYGVVLRSDSSVVIDIADLGEVEGGLGAARSAPSLDAPPRGQIQMPLLALRQLLSTAESHEGVPDASTQSALEVGVEDGRVVVGLRRAVGIPVAATLLVVVLLSVGVVWLALQNRRVARSREVLALGQRAAIASREAERLRIAREIHDGPVQRVAALALQIGGGHDDPDHATQLRDLARELRGVADGLRPPSLERFGIGAAVEALGVRLSEEHPETTIIAQVEVDPETEAALSDEDQLGLYRIAQEAANNALHHGDPSLLLLHLEAQEEILLEVIDDGSGFEWPSDLDALRDAGHFGLVGMAERAELLGGQIEVRPGRAGGAHFSLRVPKRRIGVRA